VSTLEPAERTAPLAAAADATLEAFVEAHYPRLVRLAGLVCDDPALAQDAVQAGLERAWRRRGSLNDPERLSAWLDRIVVREAIRANRARRSWLERLLAPPREIEVDIVDLHPSSSPGDEWLDVRAAFERLTAEQRAVVALHLYRGYSVAETAEIVGAPLETVRSRLRLARERLRSALAEETL
jgi:RNA polymerase sigma-70 factor (ECF subfamily)